MCHGKGIIHCDLKLDNVLFHSHQKRICKVVDFGIAGFAKGEKKEKQDAGTLPYMAPEMHMGTAADADPNIDIWALGIMMYLMLFGEFPFYSTHEDELVRRIVEDPLAFPVDICVTDQCKDLLNQILEKDTEKRIDLFDL